MRYLGEEEVVEFRNALAEELNVGPVGGVEEVWETFKKSLGKVQSCLPLVAR